MKYVLFFLFLCLSLGQLQRVSIFGGQINFYFHDIFLIMYVGMRCIKLFKKRKSINFINKDFRPFIPLIATVFVSLLIGFWNFTNDQNIVGLLYGVRLLIYFLFFACITSENKKHIEPFFQLTTVLIIIFSYIQYLLFPNFWPIIYLGWDPHLFRAVSTFFDPTTAGSIFIFLSFTNYFLYKKSKNKVQLLFALFCIPLIFLTYSRITYIMFLIGLFYMLYSQRKLWLFFAGTLLFIYSLFILPRPEGVGVKLERVFSIQSRIDANKIGVTLLKQHPLFGVGYNRIATAKKTIGESNIGHASSGFPSSFMTIAVSMGIAGLLSFMYLLTVWWRMANSDQKTLLTIFIAGCVFENIFFVGFVFLVFALCWQQLTARRKL